MYKNGYIKYTFHNFLGTCALYPNDSCKGSLFQGDLIAEGRHCRGLSFQGVDVPGVAEGRRCRESSFTFHTTFHTVLHLSGLHL